MGVLCAFSRRKTRSELRVFPVRRRDDKNVCTIIVCMIFFFTTFRHFNCKCLDTSAAQRNHNARNPIPSRRAFVLLRYTSRKQHVQFLRANVQKCVKQFTERDKRQLYIILFKRIHNCYCYTRRNRLNVIFFR